LVGTQGNAWHEGKGIIETGNETFQVCAREFHPNEHTSNVQLASTSFQIIIEAVSGQTRLSDIAIDDISILTDSECQDDEDDPSSANAESKDDDDDAVFSVDSCMNRCFEERNTTVAMSANHTLTCSCTDDCEIGVTCCPDFVGEI
jgi:Somatomedin B domain